MVWTKQTGLQFPLFKIQYLLALSKFNQAGRFRLSNKPILQCSVAFQIKQLLESGKFSEATDSWAELEEVISKNSNDVV